MVTHVESVDTRKRTYNRMSVTVHLTPGKDDDLIRVMTAVPKGQRMNVVKQTMRGVVSKGGAAALMPQQMALPMPDVLPTLNDLNERMYWVQEQLHNLPDYLNRLLAGRPSAPSPAAAPTPEPEQERASDATLHERQQRMKKARW